MVEVFAGFECGEIAGVPVLCRHDPRFKTFRFSISARRPLDERAAARSLLGDLLLQGTERDPDRPALARRMESLYGATVVPHTFKLGESHVLRFSIDSVAGRHLPDEPDQLADGFKLLADLLVRPRLEAGAFPAEVFAREKRQALDRVRGLIDDRGAYATEKALGHACAGEPFALPEHGGLEAIEALDAAAPEAVRRDFLEHGEMWAIALGSLSVAQLRGGVAALLDELPARRPETVPPPCMPAVRPRSQTLERVDLQQSKLVLVFRVPWTDDSRTWMARVLFTTMLGGGPTSRLFREVRERRSLAYYVQAVVDRHKGLLLVQIGLDEASAGAAEEETLRQMQDLSAGGFEPLELETARAGLLSSLAAVEDSVTHHLEFVSAQWLLGQDRTPAQQAEVYAAIDADEIVAAAEGIWLDHSYLLAGMEES